MRFPQDSLYCLTVTRDEINNICFFCQNKFQNQLNIRSSKHLNITPCDVAQSTCGLSCLVFKLFKADKLR